MFLMPWFDKAKNQCNDMMVQLVGLLLIMMNSHVVIIPLVLHVASFDT